MPGTVTTNDFGADIAFLVGIVIGAVVMAKVMAWAFRQAMKVWNDELKKGEP